MFLLSSSKDCIISGKFLCDILFAWKNNLFYKMLMLKKVKNRAQVAWYFAKSSSLFQVPPSWGQGLLLPEQSMPLLPIHKHVYLPFSSPPPLIFPEQSLPRPTVVRTPHPQILPILYMQALENYSVNKHWKIFTAVNSSLTLILNSTNPIRIHRFS